ncbi:hypothetical protein [Actibacterium pelagium]|uniref:Methionyl-tRNA formyltransferase n=1 Tax=Actibacterium pelagium TaxID=2029103 RepID=A0A917ACD0_9RHOB|nr:hypothetical protein [Actibacterium pelagium]GGE39904.1 hypothetical protein GCM10011517_04520 [Actibacterium pelagium]
MALVTKLEKDDRSIKALHPTQLVCRYMVEENGGRRILQLNTYGSAERDNPEKLSQTLQFSEESAQELFEMLKSEFGF